MRLTRKALATLTFASLLLGGLGVMPTQAANSRTHLSEEENRPGVTTEVKRITLTPDHREGPARQAAGICQALQKIDYPHISTTATFRAVQAHGAWNRGNCKADWAIVTTQIDRQGAFNAFFAVGTQGKGRLRSTVGMPTGSQNRVTAQYPCKGTSKARFRAWTDVDVIGIADLPNKTYSPETAPLACG